MLHGHLRSPGKTKVITEDPTDCWLAYEDAMSRYQAHQDLTLGLLMDCWDRFFFDYPELEPPGREEAMKRALQRSQEKKEARECRKPRGRGKA